MSLNTRCSFILGIGRVRIKRGQSPVNPGVPIGIKVENCRTSCPKHLPLDAVNPKVDGGRGIFSVRIGGRSILPGRSCIVGGRTAAGLE